MFQKVRETAFFEVAVLIAPQRLLGCKNGVYVQFLNGENNILHAQLQKLAKIEQYSDWRKCFFIGLFGTYPLFPIRTFKKTLYGAMSESSPIFWGSPGEA